MHIPSDGPLDYQTGLAPSERREREGQGKKRVTVGGAREGSARRSTKRVVERGKWLKKKIKNKRGGCGEEERVTKGTENVVAKKIRRRERLILQAASQRLSARSLLLLPPLSNPLATLNQELNGLLQCSFVSHQKGA